MRVCGHAIAALFLLVLSGCSLSRVLEGDISDYQAAGSDAANQLLLKNILRAADNEPLHFAEITQIHGAISFSAGISSLTFPFGDVHASNARKGVVPTVSYGQSPYFDLGTLDTQAFTAGITQPIDPKIIKYLIDNGLDQRIATLLFFSEYDDSQERRYLNSTTCDPNVGSNSPSVNAEFPSSCPFALWQYFSHVNAISGASGLGLLRAHLYDEVEPFDAIPISQASDLKVVDFTKYDVERVRVGKKIKYELLAKLTTGNVVFCSPIANPNGSPIFAFPTSTYPKMTGNYENVCKDTTIQVQPLAPLESSPGLVPTSTTKIYPRVVIRSVYGIVQYLGEILQLQEEAKAARRDRCIVLYSNSDDDTSGLATRETPADRSCSGGNVLFQVRRLEDVPHDEEAKVIVKYGGKAFAISEKRATCELPNGACDHSLEVLSLVTLLLNLNKNAKDIPPPTPTVQVNP